MGLDIISSDEEKHFHMSYISFSNMRGFFILSYREELYEIYMNILKSVTFSFGSDYKEVDGEDFFDENIGDLGILINHSDCDSELTSDECKKLRKVLFVDEDRIRNTEEYESNSEYVERMIKKMYEFNEIIEYCSGNNDVKLLFG